VVLLCTVLNPLECIRDAKEITYDVHVGKRYGGFLYRSTYYTCLAYTLASMCSYDVATGIFSLRALR